MLSHKLMQNYRKVSNNRRCLNISNSFHNLFTSKMLLIMAKIHKILVRVANRDDPNQTAYSESG